MSYSFFCYHESTKRIDDVYVKCNNCGLTIISMLQEPKNKSLADFTRENKQFNPSRYNDNIIRDQYQKSTIEYYVDKSFLNKIYIDRSDKSVQYKSIDSNAIIKYLVNINGSNEYYTNDEILDLLKQISATRITKEQYNQIKN